MFIRGEELCLPISILTRKKVSKIIIFYFVTNFTRSGKVFFAVTIPYYIHSNYSHICLFVHKNFIFNFLDEKSARKEKVKTSPIKKIRHS
jgi:hypothetical protein